MFYYIRGMVTMKVCATPDGNIVMVIGLITTPDANVMSLEGLIRSI